MKQKITEQIEVPEGISCEFANRTVKCKKDSQKLSQKMTIPNVDVKIEENKLILHCIAGNRNEYKVIKTLSTHIKNMFEGLGEKFVYELQAVNVHFPMNLKVEENKLIIDNFLGEKVPRFAQILPNVDVEIKGQEINISSSDKEAAGQTAANFERATKVKNRDRRVFQDGIYIVKKPGGKE